MFSKGTIVYFIKDKILAGDFSGAKPKITALPYTAGDITPHFQKIKKSLNPKTLKIILGENHSYVVPINIPKGKDGEQEIFISATSIIPEKITKENFDYRVIGDTKTNTVVQVFVTPIELLKNISIAALKTKIEVEHITSVSLLLAEETKSLKTPTLIVWRGYEVIAVLADKGNLYGTANLATNPKDEIERLIKSASSEYGVKVSHVVTNWPEISKLVQFPKKWKVEKKDLNPYEVIKKTKGDKKDEEILGAKTLEDPYKQAYQSSEKTSDDSQSTLAQPYDSTTILAPHIEGMEEEKETKTNRKKPSKKLFIALAFVALIGAAIVAFLLISRNMTSEDSPEEASPAEITNETQSGSESSEPEESTQSAQIVRPEIEIDLSDYSVEVQNGSGTAGVASIVQEALVDAGFVGVETANADSFDYFELTVLSKELVPEDALTAIEDALGFDYEISVSEEILEEDQEYDIIVIVGAN